MLQRLIKSNQLTLLILGMTFSLAYADTEIVLQSDKDNVPSTILIADGKLYAKEGGEKIIADPSAGEIIIINDGDKSYMVIDEAFIENMSALVSGMAQTLMSQLPPEVLAQLPPEQRAALEQLDQSADAEVNVPSIKQTGESKIVNGVKCDIYAYDNSDSDSTNSICAASAKAAKMNTDDYSTLIKLGEFMTELVAKFTASMPQMTEALEVSIMQLNLPGVPMEMINDDSVTQIVSIEEKKVDTSDYNIDGYEETDMGQMLTF